MEFNLGLISVGEFPALNTSPLSLRRKTHTFLLYWVLLLCLAMEISSGPKGAGYRVILFNQAVIPFLLNIIYGHSKGSSPHATPVNQESVRKKKQVCTRKHCQELGSTPWHHHGNKTTITVYSMYMCPCSKHPPHCLQTCENEGYSSLPLLHLAGKLCST